MSIFLNPLMLAGLGGALLPLVLHFLSRARYRTVDWGAMMFLEQGTFIERQRGRLRQMALLMMRMAVVALLAVALARPLLRGGAAGEPGAITCAIVLDRSASMSCDDGGTTRLDRAKQAAVAVLSSLQRGDRACLVTLGDDSGDEPELSTDLQAVAAQINTLTASPGKADIAAGLSRAMDVLERATGPRELYLVADRQAVSFARLDDSFQKQFAQRGRASPLKFSAIFIGQDNPDNAAVREVRMVSPVAIRNRPVEIAVDLQNYSARARTLAVSLNSDSGEIASQTVFLTPLGHAVFRASATFSDSGTKILSAIIKSGGITQDDRLDFALDVIDPPKVLVITPAGSEKSAVYPRVALEPYGASGSVGADVARVEVTTQWPQTLAPYRVVIVSNWPVFSDAQETSLRDFVARGGGLLVAPGDLTRADLLNQELGEFLPATLRDLTPADGTGGTMLSAVSSPFLPAPRAPIAVQRHYTCAPHGHVLASYASGDPFLIESPADHGHVMLMTTALDRSWSSLPVSDYYLPLMQSIVPQLASGMVESRNVDIGQPLVVRLNAPSAIMTMPDGREQTLEGKDGVVRFEQTSRPGIYSLEYDANGTNHQVLFVVRPPREESDLASIPAERLRQLARRLDFQVSTPASAVRITRPRGRELWQPLLAATFALLLGESALARRWGRRAR